MQTGIKVKIVKSLFGNDRYTKYVGQIGTIERRIKGYEIKDDCFVVNIPDGIRLLCHNKEIEAYLG